MARTLAIIGFLLACVGPFGYVYYESLGPAPSPHEERQEQRSALIIGLASPVGVLIGASIHVRFWKRRKFPFADASIAVGIFGSLAILTIIPMMGSRRYHGHSCGSNEKQLMLGLLVYAQDYDDRLPLHNSWNDAIYPYTKNTSILMCPEEEYQKLPSYGFNGALAGRTITPIKDSANAVTLIDSTTGRNREVSLQDFPFPARHQRTYVNVGFADGHVKSVHANMVQDLIWNPEWEKKKADKK